MLFLEDSDSGVPKIEPDLKERGVDTEDLSQVNDSITFLTSYRSISLSVVDILQKPGDSKKDFAQFPGRMEG